MMIGDQIFSQAELMVGALDAPGRELLRVLCVAAERSLRAQLREELDPEDYREDFVTAASLYALSLWLRGRVKEEMQEFRAGDLTVKQGQSNALLAPESLMAQAQEILRPYRKDCFRFQGV